MTELTPDLQSFRKLVDQKVIKIHNDICDCSLLIGPCWKIRSLSQLELVVEGYLYTSKLTRRMATLPIESSMGPFSWLLTIPISMNLVVYYALTRNQGNFTGWSENERLMLLLIWRENIISMTLASEALLRGQQTQSEVLFRQFLEGFGFLYLCVLEPDFRAMAASAPEDDEEFRKFWYKHLKPSLVQKRIRTHYAKIEHARSAQIKELRRQGKRISFETLKPPIFFEAYDFSYRLATTYSHLRVSTIAKNAFDPDLKGFYLGLDKAPPASRYRLVHFVEQFTYLSDALIGHLSGVIQYKTPEYSLLAVSRLLIVSLSYDGLYVKEGK